MERTRREGEHTRRFWKRVSGDRKYRNIYWTHKKTAAVGTDTRGVEIDSGIWKATFPRLMRETWDKRPEIFFMWSCRDRLLLIFQHIRNIFPTTPVLYMNGKNVKLRQYTRVSNTAGLLCSENIYVSSIPNDLSRYWRRVIEILYMTCKHVKLRKYARVSSTAELLCSGHVHFSSIQNDFSRYSTLVIEITTLVMDFEPWSE